MALLSPSIRMSFPAPLGPTINSSFPFALIIHFYTFNLGHLRFFSPFPNFNTKRLAPNRNSGSGGGAREVPGVGHPEKPGAQGSH